MVQDRLMMRGTIIPLRFSAKRSFGNIQKCLISLKHNLKQREAKQGLQALTFNFLRHSIIREKNMHLYEKKVNVANG